MKAILVRSFGPPDVMSFETVPEPVPTDDQVLVKLAAVGVNPADTYIRGGQYAALPPLPYTPGADASGMVEAIGSRVTRFMRGDRVYVAGTITGAYAELALCREAEVPTRPHSRHFLFVAMLDVASACSFRAQRAASDWRVLNRLLRSPWKTSRCRA